MPKNADQTPNAELVKLASQAKENVFAEEGTIEILKLEGVKISMNVYPVPNRFAGLMLSAIIFLEVMSANVHLDFLETHSADVKNVQEELVHANHLMFKLETNADWQDVHQAQIVNPRKHSVSKSPAVSVIALAHPVIKLPLPVNVSTSTNVLPVWPHPALREPNVPIKKVLSLVLVQAELLVTLIMDSARL